MLQAMGPLQPTFAERWIDDLEAMPLEAFARYFRPTVTSLRWLDGYYAQSSKLGHEAEVASFWDVKPTHAPHEFWGTA